MKRVVFGFALVLAALALVACGGSDDDSTTTSGGGETTAESGGSSGGSGSESGVSSAYAIPFEADPGGGLAYTEDTVESFTGNYVVEFDNPQPVGHDLAIEDEDGKQFGKTEVVSEGSSTFLVELLKPGNYTFYCTVPGHREAGMEGTLKVRESKARLRVKEREAKKREAEGK
ncbi:MAG TPA: cupredoxin domain-containing protein [Solirubrobacterales bacterium]|nr:cupredoxin domain-containing protein [Solirubrobacterales bacterium]